MRDATLGADLADDDGENRQSGDHKNAQRGNLLSAFIFSYAFCHLFIGLVADRVRNIRVFFPLMLIGWSLSTMLVGLAKSPGQIYWLRVWALVGRSPG